jgi:hypothetical protein
MFKPLSRVFLSAALVLLAPVPGTGQQFVVDDAPRIGLVVGMAWTPPPFF